MRALILATLLWPTTTAFAIDKFIALGYASGGTNLATRTSNAGYKLHAGAGFYLSGGIMVPISDTAPHAFELQLGLGYSFTDSGKDDNVVTFSRVPLEAIYYYRNTDNRFRLGWGAIYHVENRVRGKGVHAGVEADVDPAWGWTLSAQKYLSEHQEDAAFAIGLRYNSIRYRSPSFNASADGSALLFTVEGHWLDH